ncbi:MAG: ABC transporter substrate-binding protein [Propionibacteriaceae bacterium]|nr:ABC transporter substrate-binding protein [Propionibacteriaceae bacterium]
MTIKTRIVGAGIALALALSAAGCGGSGEEQVYFLNFKPEVAEVYDKIVAAYEEETGVKVKVVTAASGTYEQTLSSEIAKRNPPTIFQINGPVGYGSWSDYTADMKDSDFYAALSDKSLAVTSGDGVYGVPYVVEGYGIIYNKAIMDKYFAMPNKAAAANSIDDINSFAHLKAVVEDMQAKKADLGINGVFSATSLSPGEDWRWQTHLANVPFSYEFTANGTDVSGTPAEVTFQYGDNMQQLFDLYLNNSTTEKGQLGSKTVDDSMSEFALGQSAMVQNGNWGWNQVAGVQGNTVQAENVGFLPLYMGMAGEETQGICIGTENYFSINAKVSPELQQQSLDFLYWLFSSEKGKQFVTEDLKFIAPFTTFTDADQPNDPLAQSVSAWMNKPGVTSVSWDAMKIFPSQQWKDGFGANLLSYAQGSMEWSAVSEDAVTSWKAQAEAAG